MPPSDEVNDAVGEAPPELKASTRLTGIKRAYGSLLDQLKDELAKADKADRPRCVELCRKIGTLSMEAEALHDRFEVPVPDFSEARQVCTNPIGAGGQDRELFSALRGEFAALELCEFRLRQRRSYAEIGGTPAYEIITEAGLTEFPPLNKNQQKILAARQREADRLRRRSENQDVDFAQLPPDLPLSGQF